MKQSTDKQFFKHIQLLLEIAERNQIKSFHAI